MPEKIKQPVRASYELGKLKKAEYRAQRKGWADMIADEAISKVKFDRLSKELNLSVEYQGYEEYGQGKYMDINVALLKGDQVLHLITVDVDTEQILVDGEVYCKYLRELTITKVINELIEKIHEEYIESL